MVIRHTFVVRGVRFPPHKLIVNIGGKLLELLSRQPGELLPGGGARVGRFFNNNSGVEVHGS